VSWLEILFKLLHGENVSDENKKVMYLG